MARKEITVFVFGNYTPNSLRFSLSLGVARLLFVLLCFALLAVLVATGIVASGAYRFSRMTYLARRNRQLEQEFKKMTLLKERLEFMEKEREKLAKLLGVELTPAPVDWQVGTGDTALLPDWARGQNWGAHLVPVLVPVSGYVISRGVSVEHPGVDLACQKGALVRAVADGVVVGRGVDKQFGKYLTLRHGQGYESFYGHLDEWLVRRGDTVRVGQTIGRVGMSGQASAPHLHLEIRKDDKPLDPTALLRL